MKDVNCQIMNVEAQGQDKKSMMLFVLAARQKALRLTDWRFAMENFYNQKMKRKFYSANCLLCVCAFCRVFVFETLTN